MLCPKCHVGQFIVQKSDSKTVVGTVVRTRLCKECGYRIDTTETVDRSNDPATAGLVNFRPLKGIS